MLSQHTSGWVSTTSTSNTNTSIPGWSTNYHSSSLVKNDNDGVISSVRNDN